MSELSDILARLSALEAKIGRPEPVVREAVRTSTTRYLFPAKMTEDKQWNEVTVSGQQFVDFPDGRSCEQVAACNVMETGEVTFLVAFDDGRGGTSYAQIGTTRAIKDIRYNSSTNILQATYVDSPTELDWIDKIPFIPCDESAPPARPSQPLVAQDPGSVVTEVFAGDASGLLFASIPRRIGRVGSIGGFR